MSSNWNVYKLFKSGKRAKAPIHTFSHEGDHKEAITQFEKIEIKNLIDRYGERIKKFDFKILNTEGAQERIEVTDEQRFHLAKNRVLATIIKNKNINTKRNLSGGLIYSKDTNWNWQWAALETGTSRYIEGLSTIFTSYEEAIDWMKEKINSI